jgi:ankyrin repeat protein
MTDQPDLLKAIRAGNLRGVCAALDAETAPESAGQEDFAMGLACFLGHLEIVRALFRRGVAVSLPDNSITTSPLRMAIRGGRKDVVRLLIELGLPLPEGVETGLTEQEITVAKWVAIRDGFAAQGEKSQEGQALAPVEEIIVRSLSGVDTQVLEADALRVALRGE